MGSFEISGQDLDAQQLRRLLTDFRGSLRILAEWTDGLVELAYDTVHIQLNNIMFASDLVDLRAHADIQKQIEALPGKPPTRGL